MDGVHYYLHPETVAAAKGNKPSVVDICQECVSCLKTKTLLRRSGPESVDKAIKAFPDVNSVKTLLVTFVGTAN